MLSVGVDVGGTNITAGLVNEKNQIIGRAAAKIKIPCAPRELNSQILDVIKSAMSDGFASWKEIDFVGIGIPGAVDSKAGVVHFSSNLFMEDYKIKEMLSKIIDCPIYIENDANAAAYGEFVCGSLQNCKNALALTLGTGIGCGIIIDGKIYSGGNSAAGEIGHMTLERGGRLCNCGRNGCWERYASATGLIQTTREYLIEHPDLNAQILSMVSGNINNIEGKTAFEAKRLGYHLAAEIVDIYIRDLACGLINVINLLDPDTVCIGGGVSGAGPDLLEPLKEYVYHEIYNRNYKHTEIVLATLGNDAGIIGAANLGRQLNKSEED